MATTDSKGDQKLREESASTVSTTPDSTPSSTEGVSEDFLEPQTAQDLSDDDAPTDASLQWGTPRQMSLDSALSCGTPLIHTGCFPAAFPSGSLSDLTGRGFGDTDDGSGTSATDVPLGTKTQPSAPRGLVRTETIETFLVEEMEENPPGMSEMEMEESEGLSEAKDMADWDASPSSATPSASEALPLCQDEEETEVPRLGPSGAWDDPQVGTSGHRKQPEGPEKEGELLAEGTYPTRVETEVPEMTVYPSLSATEEELPPCDSSPLSLSETEGEEVVMPDEGPVVDTPGVAQTGGPIGALTPMEALGSKPAVRDEGSTHTKSTFGWQTPLNQLTAPRSLEPQGEMDEEAHAENRPSLWQDSVLNQSDCRKTKTIQAGNQSVIDLLYWEDVKTTGTLFGAIILALFSLTQFSCVSVLAYLALSVLSVTISLRLYTSVLHLIYKTQELHPFQSYFDLDISLTQEQLRKYSETTVYYFTSTINHLRRLILVEDLLDSLKFGVLLWLLTYIGALFNGLTLTILVVVGTFIVPLIYRKHKVQINQYLGLLRAQIKDITAKIRAKLPGSRPKAD